MELHVHLAHLGVFSCGHQLHAQLLFRSPTHSTRASNSIAWATAQLQCQRQLLSGDSASNDPKRTAVTTNKFSLDHREESNLIYSSSPSVLFCDLSLMPNEKAAFNFNLAAVPANLPPSFKGRRVRISYHLTIAYQRLNEHVKTIRIPIRMLAFQDGIGNEKRWSGKNNEDEQNRLVQSNPFVKSDDEDEEMRDLQDEMQRTRIESASTDVSQTCVRRRARVYDVVHASLGKVAKLCLLKTEFKLGEELIFILDASEAEVECVQFAASAILTERVYKETNANSPDATTNAPAITRIRYAKTAQFCLGTQISHASLELPLHAVSSYSDSTMDLSWYLEFEFVLAMQPVLFKAKEDEAKEKDDSEAIQEWNGPDKLGVQTLKWETEIKVHPPSDRGQVAQWVHAEADLYFQL